MSVTVEIMSLEIRRRKAMMDADVATLGELFADDMMWIHASATADTKRNLLSAIEAGKVRYLSIDCSEESIRMYGTLVIVSGIANTRANIAGKEISLHSRFTITWHQRAAGRWQAVHWQSTLVKSY